MNQMLDSPIEAFAFNYVSFGIFTIVNNLWTWVAVITAAISFWRIRASGASAASSCSVEKTDPKPSTCCIISRTQDESRPILEAQEKPTPSAAIAETSTASPLVCDDGVTKGRKFTLTVYYEDDGKSDDVDGEKTTVNEWRSDGGAAGYCKGAAGEWWDCWERLLRLRNGETGWYGCQDLTAINGNVVRLWDESKSYCKVQLKVCCVVVV